MSPAHPETGATILELVVVLGIVAGLSAIAAANIPRRDNGEAELRPRIEAFIRDARLAAIAGGEALVLAVSAGGLSYGDRSLAWDAATASILVGATGPAALDYRTLVAEDGSIAGPVLQLRVGNATTRIPGLYRTPLTQGGVQ